MPMELILNKNKRAGLIGTILFHLLLLLLFAFYGLKYQYPVPEQGIMINFGTSDEGMGEVQPEVSGEAVTEEKEETVSESPSQPSKASEEALTQEKIETIALPEEKKEIKKEEEQPKISEELSQALNKFKNRSKTQAGEGETGSPGDQGDPLGSKTASSHEGGLTEGGMSFNMKGRKMLSKPVVKEKSQDEGKVVVDLVVDREGNVIRAKAGAKGTTYTQNTALWKKLEEESMKIKFSPANNPYTPEEQRGTVTYVFILE
jgi:periplasmic protein TonB